MFTNICLKLLTISNEVEKFSKLPLTEVLANAGSLYLPSLKGKPVAAVVHGLGKLQFCGQKGLTREQPLLSHGLLLTCPLLHFHLLIGSMWISGSQFCTLSKMAWSSQLAGISRLVSGCLLPCYFVCVIFLYVYMYFMFHTPLHVHAVILLFIMTQNIGTQIS